MGNGGTIIIKCERCQKEYKDAHVPDFYRFLCYLCYDIPLPETWCSLSSISKTQYHSCGDNKFGISHIIGVDRDEI